MRNSIRTQEEIVSGDKILILLGCKKMLKHCLLIFIANNNASKINSYRFTSE